MAAPPDGRPVRAARSPRGRFGSGVGGDLGFVQVLIDRAGADVGDLGAFGEPVDDKRIQVLVVPHRDVD